MLFFLMEFEAANVQRVHVVLGMHVEGRKIGLTSLHSHRRTSTCGILFEIEHRRLRLSKLLKKQRDVQHEPSTCSADLTKAAIQVKLDLSGPGLVAQTAPSLQ